MNLESPLVSIITPSYNQGMYLSETIESVLSQTYANIEYIIVDGKSTDSTPQVLAKYKDLVSVIVSEEDHGQANAINKGIRLANGEIVGWLNSDDILYADSISAIVQVFIDNPGVDVVYGNVDYGSSIDQITHTLHGHEFEFINAFRRLSIPIPQQGCLWRRSAIEKCGLLNEDWHYVLDRDLFIRLADRCSLAYLNREMGLFRSHPYSKSILMNINWSRELIQLYSGYFSSSILCHSIYQYQREVMAAVYASSSVILIKSRYPILGLKSLLTAFAIDPLLLARPFFLSKIGFIR
jgi:glycosyltransferase involved in cell wall biosynthesis